MNLLVTLIIFLRPNLNIINILRPHFEKVILVTFVYSISRLEGDLWFESTIYFIIITSYSLYWTFLFHYFCFFLAVTYHFSHKFLFFLYTFVNNYFVPTLKTWLMTSAGTLIFNSSWWFYVTSFSSIFSLFSRCTI